MTLAVRFASLDRDLETLAALGGRFSARLDAAHPVIPTERDYLEALPRLMSLPNTRIFLAEEEGRLQGALGLIYAPSLWVLRVTHADELFWWTEADAKPATALFLLRAAQRDMKANRVDTLLMYSLENSPAGLTGLYESLGLRKIGTAHIGWIS